MWAARTIPSTVFEDLVLRVSNPNGDNDNFAGGLEGGGERINADHFVIFHLHSGAVDVHEISQDEQETNLLDVHFLLAAHSLSFVHSMERTSRAMHRAWSG